MQFLLILKRRINKNQLNKFKINQYTHKLYCFINHQYLMQSLIDIEEKNEQNVN